MDHNMNGHNNFLLTMDHMIGDMRFGKDNNSSALISVHQDIQRPGHNLQRNMIFHWFHHQLMILLQVRFYTGLYIPD